MQNFKSGAELFADARRSLLGHLGAAVRTVLLYSMIGLLLAQIPASLTFENMGLRVAAFLSARFLVSLMYSLVGIGLASFFLGLQFGQPVGTRRLFLFLFENPDRCVRTRFFVTAGEFACLLPVQILSALMPWNSIPSRIVPVSCVGIICLLAYAAWSLTFSMVDYLIVDFPDLEPLRVLDASRRMMRGNRLRLLALMLRILPLHLLGLFSLGLANIWAGCCQHACCAAFYRELMTQKRQK